METYPVGLFVKILSAYLTFLNGKVPSGSDVGHGSYFIIFSPNIDKPVIPGGDRLLKQISRVQFVTVHPRKDPS